MGTHKIKKNDDGSVDLRQLRHDIVGVFNAMSSSFNNLLQCPELKDDCEELFKQASQKINMIASSLEEEFVKGERGHQYDKT